MAQGSEQISRKWLEGVTHFTCCGEKIRRLADVGEVRTRFNPTRREVYCMEHRRGRVVVDGVDVTAGVLELTRDER